MCKHGACNLSSINLAEFVNNPYTYNAEFDFDSFKKAVIAGIRYLDHIVDITYNRQPLKEQQEAMYTFRNCGLGAFGYGSALMKMNIKYGSQEALNFTDELFNIMFRTAVEASSNLAKEKGNFPGYTDKVWESKIIKNHFSQIEIDKLKEQGLRNCSLLSIAPNGSISTLLGESGGVEPEFSISYTRRTVGMTNNEDHYYKIYCKTAKEYMEVNHTDTLPDWFVSALEINPFDRINAQAIMQNHIDTAISSTINLPENTTNEQVAQIYLEAWKQGLKGITIFRANCKRVGILTIDAPKKESVEKKEIKEKEEKKVTENKINSFYKVNDLPRGAIIECSNDLIGKKRKLITGCGSLHVEAWFDPVNGDLLEVFLNKGSSGGCSLYMNGLSRCISLLCRAGVDIYTIKDQLDSTGTCPSYNARRITKHDTSKGACCPMAVGNALLEMYQEMQSEIEDDDIEDDDSDFTEITKPVIKEVKEVKKELAKVENKTEPYQVTGLKCPECGEPLVFEGGCNSCKNCGYSKCE